MGPTKKKMKPNKAGQPPETNLNSGTLLLDMRKRKQHHSVVIFRDQLLKKFTQSYDLANFETINTAYEEIAKTDDQELHSRNLTWNSIGSILLKLKQKT